MEMHYVYFSSIRETDLNFDSSYASLMIDILTSCTDANCSICHLEASSVRCRLFKCFIVASGCRGCDDMMYVILGLQVQRDRASCRASVCTRSYYL